MNITRAFWPAGIIVFVFYIEFVVHSVDAEGFVLASI